MTKTFQYMPSQIRHSLNEIVENLDFSNLTITFDIVRESVEKYQANSQDIITGITNQILHSYFIKKNKDKYYIHPMLKFFSESTKNQNEILHYGLYRYTESYFDAIEFLYDEFDRLYGDFKQSQDLIKLKLMKVFEKTLAQKSVKNNVERALKWLTDCDFIMKKRGPTGGFNYIINEYEPNPFIFFFSLLDELKKEKYPDINESWLLKKSKIVKIWFLRKRNLSKILKMLMKSNYILFGQLTGNTINLTKSKFERWNFYYNLK